MKQSKRIVLTEEKVRDIEARLQISREGHSSHGETAHPLYAAVRFPLALNALYNILGEFCQCKNHI
jgi:hypothetical protein